jgi:hypothetical protein
MEKPTSLISLLLERPEYCTAYAFNSMVAPRFTRAINSRFNHVETDMTGISSSDSKGTPYTVIKSVIYDTNLKGNPDNGLTALFLEQVEKRLEGKNKFVSWQLTPQMRVSEERKQGTDFKVYTLISSFTAT